MNTLTIINLIFGALTVICFGYQWILAFLPLVKKQKKYPDAPPKKYAVLISARNEKNVIGHLLDSLNKQDYPADMLDVFVVADNCTDNTADIARSMGARVLERQNDVLKGKGFALNDLVHYIWDTVGKGVYYGYLVFDADNVVRKDFIKEINKAMSNGNRIAIGYRNYKSKMSNWISYCYNMFWLRESVQLNRGRNTVGASAYVTGTGYCMTEDILLADGGFKATTLTEDCELTLRWITRGEKIAYCNDAMFYDEQPSKFRASFKQRARWVRGSLQCYLKYAFRLFKGCFRKSTVASCLDQLAYMFIPIGFGIISFILNIAFGIPMFLNNQLNIGTLLISAGIGLGVAIVYTMLLPLSTIITERKNIKDPIWKCVFYSVFYPIFMVTYIPIIVYAIFFKVGWAPIKHTETLSIDEIERQ